MDLNRNMNLEMAQLDISVVVVASIIAAMALVLVVVSCACCFSNKGRRSYSSFSSSGRRDTVPLDDLLSKPSLADPESVFSETGSYAVQLTAHTNSWFGHSGDGSSLVQESFNLPSPSSEDKQDTNMAIHSSNTADSQISLSPKKKRNSHSKTSRLHEKETEQHRDSSQLQPTAGLKSSSRMKASISVKSDVSLKNSHTDISRNSHTDMSRKVGLDSTGLKIHRDSVTRDSVPFLSSTRCSFSHEVGHIAHGNKLPRTSLPRTEEAADGNQDSASTGSQSQEKTCRVGTADLSFQVQTEHNQTYSGSVTIDSCQEISRSNVLESIDMKSGHGKIDAKVLSVKSDDMNETGTCNKVCSRPNGSSESNTDHSRTENSEFQNVPMRRCLSYVQEVPSEETAKSCRKTISLNVKIDVHFDNERGTDTSLPTVVCSPLTEYNSCHKYAASESKHDKHNSKDSNKSAPDNAKYNNQIVDSTDFDAKEKLLEKTFASKSQMPITVPTAPVRKRLSEPTVIEDNERKIFSNRLPSRRLSESLEQSVKQVQLPHVTAGVNGHRFVRDFPAAGVDNTCLKISEIIPIHKCREVSNTAAVKPKVTSQNEKGFIESEQPLRPIRPINATDLQQDAECLKLKVETEQKQTDNDITRKNAHAVTPAEKPKVIPRKSISGISILSKLSNNTNESTEILEHDGNGERLVSTMDHGIESSKSSNATEKQEDSEAKTCKSTDKKFSTDEHFVACSVKEDVQTDSSSVVHTDNVFKRRSRSSSASVEIQRSYDTEVSIQASNAATKEKAVLANKGPEEVCISHEQHTQASTVKEGSSSTILATNDTFDYQFRRSSSVKEHTFDKRVRRTSLTSDNNSGRRMAILFHNTESHKESPDKVSIKNVEHLQDKKVLRVEESHNEETFKRTTTNLSSSTTYRSEGSKEPNKSQSIDKKIEINKTVKDNDTASHMKVVLPTLSVNFCKSQVSGQQESQSEMYDVSDDSDYDNPWDNLDDAVKRASIRYNRRPSRIAAGDAKTLLLKSAEDLGRLLEEADKRRQLRIARNSCQVVPPDHTMESMTIPFTRFSPHRHTVKGIVSQQPISTSQSSEDILNAQTETFQNLNSLPTESETVQSGKAIDIRRPMSLISKAKAKISSPETKKRKK